MAQVLSLDIKCALVWILTGFSKKLQIFPKKKHVCLVIITAPVSEVSTFYFFVFLQINGNDIILYYILTDSVFIFNPINAEKNLYVIAITCLY